MSESLKINFKNKLSQRLTWIALGLLAIIMMIDIFVRTDFGIDGG